MKKKLVFTSIMIAGIAICFSACNKEEILPDTPKSPSLNLPSTPYSYNSLFASDEMIALGRVLFYDDVLAGVHVSVSCGTCHMQVMGFSNGQYALGFRDRFDNLDVTAQLVQGVKPGSAAPINPLAEKDVSAMKTLANDLCSQANAGMSDEAAVIANVAAAPYYPALFKKAFGAEDVSMQKVSSAVTAFTASIAVNARAADTDVKTDPKFSSPFTAK